MVRSRLALGGVKNLSESSTEESEPIGTHPGPEFDSSGTYAAPTAEVTRRSVFWHAILGRGRGRSLSFATVGLMIHQACEAAIPVLLGVTIDRAIATRDLGQLWWCLAALAVTFLILTVSYQKSSYKVVDIYSWGEHDLRQRSLARVLHPLGMVEKHGAGTALSITTSDSFRVAGVVWSIAQQASTIAAILVSGIVLLTISVWLGLGVFAGAFIMLAAMQHLARPLERVGMAEQASVANASEIAGDVVAGLRIVHGLHAQSEMSRRYREASEQSRRGAVRAGQLLLSYTGLSSIFSVVFLTLIALAAGLLVVAGDVTPGQLVTVVGLAQFLQNSLAYIGTFGANWSHKRASATRMSDFLSNPYLLSPGVPAAVETDHEAPLLQWRESDLSVPLNAGLIGVRVTQGGDTANAVSETIGLWRRPGRDELFLNGRSVLEIGPEQYRKQIVAPPKNGYVFTGTLAENVVGERGDIDARISDAVALDEIIDSLGGSNGDVGENGRRLSGGQRQRVLLAKAMHTDADLVVLNEPTTALDPITEQRVAHGLRELDRPILVFTTSRILLAACTQVIDLATDSEGR